MWDFSGRCWSALPGRCDGFSAQVPNWPGALWPQQHSSELKIRYPAFRQALLASALCHADCGSALELTCAQLAGSMRRVYIKHNVGLSSRVTYPVDLSSISFSPQQPNPNPSEVKRTICISFVSLSDGGRRHLPQY